MPLHRSALLYSRSSLAAQPSEKIDLLFRTTFDKLTAQQHAACRQTLPVVRKNTAHPIRPDGPGSTQIVGEMSANFLFARVFGCDNTSCRAHGLFSRRATFRSLVLAKKELGDMVRRFLVAAVPLWLCSCAAGSSFQGEFASLGLASVGRTDTSQMSNDELHGAIERAYLNGELTTEQARIAHTQLDVKGHLTAEQIAVINRDRLAERHKYETNKESLDVVRDVGQTGSSVLSDINQMKETIQVIFD